MQEILKAAKSKPFSLVHVKRLREALSQLHQDSFDVILLDLTLIAGEETVIFRIQDEGIGIPLEDQKQLFEPFTRASNVDNIPGTGLGLAIVRSCVEAHGGQISVESDVGAGTTFTVTLPLIR